MPTSPGPASGAGRAGRPPVTTAQHLEEIGFELFTARGFEATTVDDIASAAGISRRTFFHYYPSKNDLVWGDFEAHLRGLREGLAATPDAPMMDVLRRAVVEVSRVGPGEADRQRQRIRLILTVPVLQAHSALRYQAWRDVVAAFVAGRLGCPDSSFVARLIGSTALAASMAAHEQWLHDPASDLVGLLHTGLTDLTAAFAHHEQPR